MNYKETIMNNEIEKTKKCVESLYRKYMAEVTDNMIDDVANSLIGIIAELEALKLRMHSSYDEERLGRKKWEKMFYSPDDNADEDNTTNKMSNADYFK
jgi:hypothetical protein